MPPATPFWSAWLIPGGTGIALLLLVAALVPALLSRRSLPDTAPAKPAARPKPKPAVPGAHQAGPGGPTEPEPAPAPEPAPSVPAALCHDDHLGGPTLDAESLAGLARSWAPPPGTPASTGCSPPTARIPTRRCTRRCWTAWPPAVAR